MIPSTAEEGLYCALGTANVTFTDGTSLTASGDTLWIRMNGERNVVVLDAEGGVANISTYDVIQSNGIIHVVDRVLLPR